MNNRLLLLPCIAILLAFGLSACGGGGGGDEASEVEDVIETSAVTTDPADCKKLETQKFMEQLSQQKGAAAVKQCELEAESGEGAKSVSVSNVVIGGSNASAELTVEGGGFDGQTAEVALVKEGDQWKVDELVSFTKLDQDRLVEVFEREFAKPSNKLNPKLKGCVLEVFEKGSQEEVEELLLSGSTKAFEEVAESCK